VLVKRLWWISRLVGAKEIQNGSRGPELAWFTQPQSSLKLLQPARHPVSFCVERGELLGFIGPNGAGKSTTIKIALMLATEQAPIAWTPAKPLLGFVFLGAAFLAWRWGVRHYMSTGS
jgi:ATPase subunit of ABC transporter with duplicated ATPase domains